MIYIKIEKITQDDLKAEIEKIKNKFYERKFDTNSTSIKNIEYGFSNFKDVDDMNNNVTKVDIKELLKLNGKDFINEVYKKILLREPNEEEFKYLLNLLKSGNFSKLDIIFKVRYSKEGRLKKVKIKGLFPKGVISIFSFIPIVNIFVKWLRTFIFLNRIDAKLKILENLEFDDYFSNLNKILILENRISKLKKEILNLKEEINKIKFNLPNLLEEIDINEYLEEKIKLGIDEKKEFYFSFEDLFRGSEEDISNRFKFYLNKLKKSKKPVLDIGCGRCEFLKVLKENKINGLGIDVNKSFINYCKRFGLNVINIDAITYLQNSNETFSNITIFHVLEHLSLEEQLILLKNAYLKLEVGGKIIIETPNPIYWNSFASFYIDPTHIKPIPATTLAFYLEYIGFKNISVFYLHPDRKKIYKEDKLLRYYQDFAIIGEK